MFNVSARGVAPRASEMLHETVHNVFEPSHKAVKSVAPRAYSMSHGTVQSVLDPTRKFYWHSTKSMLDVIRKR